MDSFENKDEKVYDGESIGEEGSGVRYYSDGRFSDFPKNGGRKQRKKLPAWIKALIVIIVIFCGLGLIATSCSKSIDKVTSSLTDKSTTEVVANFDYDYIGKIYVEGEMGSVSTGSYNQEHLLNAIDAMIADDHNKGMIIYVDTPGGEVFAIDHLYEKICEYKEKTGRPVYSSMQSMAASGGYYISAPCDVIFADRNCWTGSIGVIMGTMIDASELLDKLGIKTTTIASGPNKGMGSSLSPLTQEQKEIMQSLIDEAYDRFVEIVAKGRKMNESKVRKIADGRIYSAKQALKVGLVDEIGTFDEALADMKKRYKLDDCCLESFVYEQSNDLFSLLSKAADGNVFSSVPDADMIRELAALNGKVKLCYLATVSK